MLFVFIPHHISISSENPIQVSCSSKAGNKTSSRALQHGDITSDPISSYALYGCEEAVVHRNLMQMP